MPLQTKPEDKPAAVCFHLDFHDGSLAVTVSALPGQTELPYRIEGGTPRFRDRDHFKGQVIAAGFTPAVAEDPGRSFNATARQLMKLGFSVQLPEQKQAA